MGYSDQWQLEVGKKRKKRQREVERRVLRKGKNGENERVFAASVVTAMIVVGPVVV